MCGCTSVCVSLGVWTRVWLRINLCACVCERACRVFVCVCMCVKAMMSINGLQHMYVISRCERNCVDSACECLGVCVSCVRVHTCYKNGLEKSLYDFTGTIFAVCELTSTTMRSCTRGLMIAAW